MGIRIHVCMGFGITDADPDLVKFLCDWEPNAFEYIDWLDSKPDVLLQEMEAEGFGSTEIFLTRASAADAMADEFGLSRCIVHDNEGGDPGVMLIQPFANRPAWQRYDDHIDYYQADGMDPKVKLINSGFFPYNVTMLRMKKPSEAVSGADGYRMIEARKRKRLDRVAMDTGEYNQLVGRWDPSLKPYSDGAVLEHLLNDWRPMIHPGVIAVMVYAGFPDVRGLMNRMRPMIYTYWG